MKKFLVFSIGLSALTACAVPTPEPAVASFNEASVGIRLNGTTLELSPDSAKQEAFNKADAMAARICAQGPNRRAEYASTRNIPTGQYSYEVERLYLCLR